MSERREQSQCPVAIVGLGSLLPGAAGVDQAWRMIVSGRDEIREIPEDRWRADEYYSPDPATPDKVYARRGGFVPKVSFDPLAFGVPPTTLPATDASQMLALVVAEQMLADVRSDLAQADRERVSVILGATAYLPLLVQMSGRLHQPLWRAALREAGVTDTEADRLCAAITDHMVPWQEATFPGLLPSVISGRIANRFDLHGTNHTTDAACASSLAAIVAAVDELAVGRADLVITGGVDTANDEMSYMCFSKTPALSPTGDARPFSAAADGTILGEGVVMLALKRLADAERDSDRIYAVIRGIGTASDGRSNAIYAPLPAGQARALRRAYRAAGYEPGTVGLVEAHGTGTKAGDLAEFSALREVFEEGRDVSAGPQCALGSIKSQIGHTKGAAGAAGVLKAALALHQRVLPPTIKVDAPNPELDMESSPFYLNTGARPWFRDDTAQPLRASVSSFGFGGTNFHLALEEYRPAGGAAAGERRLRSAPTELVLVGADSPAALSGKLDELEAQIVPGEADLADIARASQAGFRPGDRHRLALVAGDLADLSEKIMRARGLLSAPETTPAPAGVHHGSGPGPSGRLAFLFPGQGSQYLGMGGPAAIHHPAAHDVWEGLTVGGTPLHRIVFPPPTWNESRREEQRNMLRATEWAQPALAAHCIALLAVLNSLGLQPDCVAGHSLGELIALHAAEAYDADTLVGIARRRGELMRDACPGGAGMAAVLAGPDRVEELLRTGGYDRLWMANRNAPQQTVVAGADAQLDAFARVCEDAGITVHRLEAAGAFHTPLVESARTPFHEFLADLPVEPVRIETYGNADAAPYPADSGQIRDRLAAHITSAVRFNDQIEAMYAAGVRTFVEVGPSGTLTGLVGRILADRPHTALALDRRGDDQLLAFNEALARLAVDGYSLDFEGYWRGYTEPAVQRPATAASVRIDGGNLGKKYPGDPAHIAVPAPISPIPFPEPTDNPSATEPPMSQLSTEQVRLIADAHTAFQERMTQAHTEFLRCLTPETHATPALTPPVAAPIQPAAAAPVSAQLPAPAAVSVAPAAPAAPARAVSAVAEPEPGPAVGPLFLEVVAERSGYPVSMLTPEMDLETDLGIDSLKRVDILTTLRRRLGGAELGDLAGLRTIAQITATLDTTVAPRIGSAPAESTAAPHPGPAVGPLFLEVVAERSGYPVSMLTPEMDLETDLGIDSLKRVDILTTLRRRLGGAELGDLAGLRTIAQITATLDTTVTPSSPRNDPDRAQTRPAPEPESRSQEVAPAVVVRRIEPRLRRVPPSGLAAPGLEHGPIHVVDGGSGLGELVVDAFAAAGQPAVQAGPDDALPDDACGLVLLAGLRRPAGVEEALNIQRDAFRTVRSCASTLARTGFTLVTVQDTGGDFGLRGAQPASAWLGGIAALTRTAAKEWPDLYTKAIDCEQEGRTAAEVAVAIVEEILVGGPAHDVALRADEPRYVLDHLPARPAEPTPLPVDDAQQSVVVVSGGARGITAHALRQLARSQQPRFVLLGRTERTEEPAGLPMDADEAELVTALADSGLAGTPAEVSRQARAVLAGREITATLAALGAAGSEARYIACDITDADAVADALTGVRAQWGPITAVVHAAGVVADQLVADKTDDAFEAVFTTKTLGLHALLLATADDPLSLLCIFGSVSGSFGNPGQADYAMANETIAQVASATRRPGLSTHAIAWGPWDGGMVTAALAEHFTSQGTPLLPLDAGADAFVAEITGTGPTRMVITAVYDEPANVHGDSGTGAAGESGPTAPPITQHSGHCGASAHVSASSHPYLTDHVIAGTPVLPIAQVAAWFTSVMDNRGTGGNRALRDLQVLRKVTLPGLEDGGHRFRIAGRPTTDGMSLTLSGADSQVHYRGHIGTARPQQYTATPGDLVPWTARPDVYDGHYLFHGPLLHALHAVEGIAPAGARATLAGARQLGWPDSGDRLDVAAFDGALQLAALWAEPLLGGAVLPIAIGQVQLHTSPSQIPDEPLGCTVYAGPVEDARAVCDITIATAGGEKYMTICGLEQLLRPDSQ